jgi:GxxExxY protein
VDENAISKIIVGAAIDVHRVPGGPGLRERVNEEGLIHELHLRGLKVDRQQPVLPLYKGVKTRDPTAPGHAREWHRDG